MTVSDSPDNWLQIRLVYADGESITESICKRMTVDRLTLHKAVQMDADLGLWNIEWAIKSIDSEKREGPQEEFLALRTQPLVDRKERVKKELTEHARRLMQQELIRDFKFDNRTWLQSNVCPDYLLSWDEWFVLLRVLNHLSRALHEIWTLPDYARVEYFLHEKLVHHAHNMLHIQDSFRPTVLQKKIGILSRALLMTCPRLLTAGGVVSWPKTGITPQMDEEKHT